MVSGWGGDELGCGINMSISNTMNRKRLRTQKGHSYGDSHRNESRHLFPRPGLPEGSRYPAYLPPPPAPLRPKGNLGAGSVFLVDRHAHFLICQKIWYLGATFFTQMFQRLNLKNRSEISMKTII